MHLSDLNCEHDLALTVRQHMHFLRLDTKGFASLMGVHPGTVSKWMTGYPVPGYVLCMLKTLAYTEALLKQNKLRSVQDFLSGRIDVEIVPVIKEVV